MTENANQQYHIHITSHRPWYELNLKEVWRYRDLIVLLTKRNFVVAYKQTILGPAWMFINPFLTSVMHTIVFGNIAKLGTDGIPHILFYFTSNAIWNYFSSCLSNNANTFRGNAGVFGKVYFPRLVAPISNVLATIIRFGIQMLMVIGFLIYYLFQGAVHPHWTAWLLIPAVLVHLGIMGMGFGIIVSSMTTKYRDLSILVGFGLRLWMYGTPIVYTIDTLGSGTLRTLCLINPVTMPVEVFRYAVLGTGNIIPEYVALSWIITVLVAVFGIMVFNHVEKTFMDTV